MRRLITFLLVVISAACLIFIAWKLLPHLYEPVPEVVKPPLDGKTMVVDPSDDPTAAQCEVEVVVMGGANNVYNVILRAKSPNMTEKRCAMLAMEQQGFIRVGQRSGMQSLLVDADGWTYFYDSFASPERD